MTRRHRSGFTLLELILSLAMVAMLSLTLYVSMTVAFKARRSAEAAVAPARAVSIAADLIGRDLENVVPPTGLLSGPFYGTIEGGAGGAGEGELAALEFHSVGSDGELIGPGGAGDNLPLVEGVRRVSLFVDSAAQPPVLVRRVTRNLLAATEEQPEDEVVCRGVRNFAVRYYDGTTWTEDWDSTIVDNALPMAVLIELAIEVPSPNAATPPSVARVTRLIPIATAQPLDTTGTGVAQ